MSVKVELEVDETWALLSVITQKLLEEGDLSEEDRANLQRWRGEELRRSGDAIRSLTQKLSDDLQRVQRTRERSKIQRHDWV
jgi:hypothetical protein